MSAEVRWNDGAAGRIKEATSRGLFLAAEHVLGVARRLVPIEEGTLERSGEATVDGLTAAVSFDTPYAVRQHEDLTLRHQGGRQAKYLETAAQQESATVLQIIAQDVRAVMGG